MTDFKYVFTVSTVYCELNYNKLLTVFSVMVCMYKKTGETVFLVICGSMILSVGVLNNKLFLIKILSLFFLVVWLHNFRLLLFFIFLATM